MRLSKLRGNHVLTSACCDTQFSQHRLFFLMVEKEVRPVLPSRLHLHYAIVIYCNTFTHVQYTFKNFANCRFETAMNTSPPSATEVCHLLVLCCLIATPLFDNKQCFGHLKSGVHSGKFLVCHDTVQQVIRRMAGCFRRVSFGKRKHVATNQNPMQLFEFGVSAAANKTPVLR